MTLDLWQFAQFVISLVVLFNPICLSPFFLKARRNFVSNLFVEVFVLWKGNWFFFNLKWEWSEGDVTISMTVIENFKSFKGIFIIVTCSFVAFFVMENCTKPLFSAKSIKVFFILCGVSELIVLAIILTLFLSRYKGGGIILCYWKASFDMESFWIFAKVPSIFLWRHSRADPFKS